MTSRKTEGCLLQVALNNKHAWYLTDRGVSFFFKLNSSKIIFKTTPFKNLFLFVNDELSCSLN
jgi:hypothetical protein